MCGFVCMCVRVCMLSVRIRARVSYQVRENLCWALGEQTCQRVVPYREVVWGAPQHFSDVSSRSRHKDSLFQWAPAQLAKGQKESVFDVWPSPKERRPIRSKKLCHCCAMLCKRNVECSLHMVLKSEKAAGCKNRRYPCAMPCTQMARILLRYDVVHNIKHGIAPV